MYKYNIHVVGDLLELFDGLQIFKLKLANELSWANKGISLVDPFYFWYIWVSWIG